VKYLMTTKNVVVSQKNGYKTSRYVVFLSQRSAYRDIVTDVIRRLDLRRRQGYDVPGRNGIKL
jgi:hypothetical protein